MTLRGPCRFINGMKAQHTPLKEARIIFYGAGSSAVGVATMIAQLISKETGIPFDEAKKVSTQTPLKPYHTPMLLRARGSIL